MGVLVDVLVDVFVFLFCRSILPKTAVYVDVHVHVHVNGHENDDPSGFSMLDKRSIAFHMGTTPTKAVGAWRG